MGAARKHHNPQSTLLAARLKARIARDGPLSVAAFMEACLADTGAGYYTSRQPIGEAGDFITAPEVSQMFGELLGLWAVAVWQSMGEPRPVVVAELGPGRGTLMADSLRAWRSVPDFHAAVRIALVETSPVLREAQQVGMHEAIAPVQWYGAIEDVPPGPLIVIANEFVDALPVRQLVWRDGVWRERCVTIGRTGGFAFCEGREVWSEGLRQAAHALRAPEGSILEVRPAAAALIAALATRAREAPLAALFVDYGHTETACGDTLQAVSRHQFADPLAAPGEVDLTAHVDFAALKDVGLAHGLAAYGPMPQGEFLLKLGLEARRDRLYEKATPEQKAELASGASRLVDPQAMGLLFKALALTSPGLAPPPPFGEI
ncbi:MAG: class I SAM-dependent methyltransferase [Methyloceanibacter sp.]|uniref:class I SAM-dependent methyltransferase n=1 Tax=Methyloceanibacter sp. TaxID=1965321 RepID=UPI003D6D2867